MADDNNSRYPSSDPFSRGPAPGGPASDPLAELARLIGQNDPFADYSREPRPVAEPEPAARFAHQSPPEPTYGGNGFSPRYESEPAQPHYDPEPRPYDSEPPRYAGEPPMRPQEPPPAPRFVADFPPRRPAAQTPLDDWPGSPPSPPPPPSFLVNDPFALPSQQHAAQPGRAPFEGPAFHDRLGPLSPPPMQPPPGFAQPQHPFPPAPEHQAYSSQPIYPHEPEAGAMPPPHDDEFYDDAPRGGRRKGLLTVAAVFGLAVLGTAGAFGYRSLFGGHGASSPPPVIRASNEPNKVPPPAPANPDPSASKFSYDRFSEANKDEQVVRREETPVDVPRPSAAPRTVLPGAPLSNMPQPKPNTATTAANPPSVLGEPRKVRTVPIRPEAEGVTTSPNAAGSQPPPAPAPVSNAPLSLSPDANNGPPSSPLPPPSAPQSITPRAVAPTRVASAPATASAGRYLVQVSSQKSEADAQASFRNIQAKYASVLGSHPHVIRRADLGSKGIYYRAMVGPFASREEAVQLCSSLKRAGGDCVVQH
jgi:hypothetical protein